jgi:hypothetical protein
MRIFHTLLLTGFFLPNIKDTTQPVFNMYSIRPEAKVPPNFYATQTGFFCKSERALEKQTKVSVKIRLGSVEQTQKLEGYGSTLPSSHK